MLNRLTPQNCCLFPALPSLLVHLLVHPLMQLLVLGALFILTSAAPALAQMRAARGPVSESQVLAQAAGLVVIWEPKLPHELVAEFEPPAELVQWFRSWEQKLAGGASAGADEVESLDKLLSTSHLLADQCVAVLKAVQPWEEMVSRAREQPYGPVSGALACAAIYAGAREIHSDRNHLDQQMAIIAPLIKRLWFGRARDARAVETFYTLLTIVNPKGAPDWVRGHLGRAEALGIQGRHAEAVAGFDQLLRDYPAADAGLVIKINFDKGIVLYQSDDFAGAVASLQAAAGASGFEGSRYARELLMQSRAKLGDSTGAADDLRRYVRDYQLPESQALAWVNVIKTELLRADQRADQLVGGGVNKR